MRKIMAAMRRNLHLLSTKKNTSRVADEDFASAAAVDDSRSSRCNTDSGASFLCGIVVAPFSLFSCLSSHCPRINGPDGVWVSADLSQTSSELTHLMVRDSLRYAILM